MAASKFLRSDATFAAISPGDGDGFASGTLAMFVQSAAPSGWTISTTHNDKVLRIVSGSPGSGGTLAFSTVFGRTASDSYALLLGDIPAHAHNQQGSSGTGGGTADFCTVASNNSGATSGRFTTTSVGGGGGHSHGMDIRVQYVDAIICLKS